MIRITVLSFFIFLFSCSEKKSTRSELDTSLLENKPDTTNRPKPVEPPPLQGIEIYTDDFSSEINTNEFYIEVRFKNNTPQQIALESPAKGTNGSTTNRLAGTFYPNKDSLFIIKGTIDQLGFYKLQLNEGNVMTLIIDKGEKIKIDINGDKNLVSGSVVNLELQDYMDVVTLFQKNPYVAIQPIKDFINRSNNPLLISMAIGDLFRIGQGLQLDIEGQEYPFFKKLATRLKNDFPDESFTDNYIKTFQQIDSTIPAAVSKPAPDIVLKGVNGELIKLSQLRGQYVLLDFWASWCRPCRSENPNVVKNYNKYHSKGFTVMNVSLDTDANKWKEAIQQDGLIWKNHVIDTKQQAASVYRVTGIPHTLLIDNKGIIIAKNLRGAELERKLKEIFNF